MMVRVDFDIYGKRNIVSSWKRNGPHETNPLSRLPLTLFHSLPLFEIIKRKNSIKSIN